MTVQNVVTNGPGVSAAGDPAQAGPLRSGTATVTIPSSLPRLPQARSVVLRVENLGKTFRSGFLRKSITGIAGVSFTVPEGSVFAILGHNGAGKTTTINCILDLVHADTGEVEIFGMDHRLRQTRAQVGYLPERPYFFEHLTGRELLSFYASLLDVPPHLKSARIDSVLELTGMTEAAGRRLGKYSKGMLQRIGLAQALIGDPQLLILDEPMSGLDPMGRREVRELLLDLKARGKTIILSSHIVPDVEVLADAVGVLRDGRLVMTRSLDEIAGGTSYRIRLKDSGDPKQSRTITVSSVDALQEVMARCHTDGVPIIAVEPCRSDLEDLFLAAHKPGKVAS